jgi:phosphatidylinositol glycan class B
MPNLRRTPWAEVFLAALPAALHAVVLLGRLHPDELFQSLEVALHRHAGFGIMAWEWEIPAHPETALNPWGIRNWAVPMLFSALFRLGDLVGISSVMGRRVLLEIPQYALHAAMLAAVFRLVARRLGEKAGRWSLWLVALYGPVVWFGGRTLSESFSVAFLVWGLERLDAEGESYAQALLGGLLLGLAEVTRYGSAAAIVPAMVWLLVKRRYQAFALATLSGLLVALALGLLDKLTWGEWFHSFIHYVRYNVLSGSAAQNFGALPWYNYVPRLLLAPFAVIGLGRALTGTSARPWVAATAAFSVCAVAMSLSGFEPRWPALLGLAAVSTLGLALMRPPLMPALFVAAGLGYAVIVSAAAHKEDRFLYPTLVLLTIAAAPLFCEWALAATHTWQRAIAGALVLAQVSFFLFPSPFDVQRKEQFQMVAQMSHEATGLVIMNEGLWGSPGFFYLGKNIPWCTCDFPHDGCFQAAARDGRFNRGLYWVTVDEKRNAEVDAAFSAAGFRVLEQRGLAKTYARP